ncbi:hypothetical protein LU293_03970 [Moraxella nasovis]|uniref:hypothetical protein n=1 Tax=Moraxella nasovis TaxID=2904121 RepID=UPI001F600ACF|nr:hypothetical protein [Moraxella nasovis]UNU74058.1 hypothetical protein LU293_03970 [Moraxella nasovis]
MTNLREVFNVSKYNMNYFKLKQVFDEIISLSKNDILGNNTPTTKYLAVKPNRHTLAIFSPTTGENTPYSEKSVYGGLIGANTRPKGNSPSRLDTVVETCHPICWVVKATKYLGAFAMNQSILNHSLTVLSDEYHRYNELHAQEPFNGYCERANAIYNAIHALKSLNNAPCATYAPPKPKSALKRILGVFKGGAK